MRALLALMRENKTEVQDLSGLCQNLLRDAMVHLKILDPVLGEKKLIASVAAQVANLPTMAAQVANVRALPRTEAVSELEVELKSFPN